MSHKCDFDDSLLTEFTSGNTLVAGVDEVGRGSIFGSVVAASIVLPLSLIPQLVEIGVKDSKKLSKTKREELVPLIQEISLAHHVSYATAAEIDCINILQASLLAMKRSLLKLEVDPHICLVDGKFAVPNLSFAQKTVVKGDMRSPVIAAASILAKVWRDDLITDLATQYPQYDLANNKGYPTAAHRLAIKRYGICAEHRRSFKTCKTCQ